MNLEQNFDFYDEFDFQDSFGDNYLGLGGITKVYAFSGGFGGPRPFRGPKRFGDGGGFSGGKFKGSNYTPKILNLPQYSPSYKPKLNYNPVFPGLLPIKQNFKIQSSHKGKNGLYEGSMKIYTKPGNRMGNCLHTFNNGHAHIDIGSKHLKKLGIKRLGYPKYIKNLRGYF